MAITSVGQEYEFMESQHDYRMRIGTTFRGREAPMNIGKFQDNFDKDGKPKYFNCNIYGHIVKECRRPKRNKKMRKCYKYNKVGHLAKDYRSGWKMKIRRNQKELDKENDNKKEGFIKGSE